ncbi:pyridine nucleotide-disulfide oxidoreductase-domain-containing protein [Hypoxylon trugodes]|uniref:pyridine nucleotide-disulfide oxidoreductase-domain-containing protein n=1 Tax=Hypoxylon trugodes TaxID=326681 RepID=UPI00219875F7|nr:pyridine nucleotide-disulfide oxidoreductase-domain-containing protein [Hypoxylon trugodes]KAI1388034.1 pyridine nucleotide-disulfide oxidoreductase-domain-containing protein [Hypoxylon trugodes]
MRFSCTTRCVPLGRLWAHGRTLPSSSKFIIVMDQRRCMASHTSSKPASSSAVTAVVVGGGASGIAVVGNLLELLHPNSSVAWIDPLFQGGRINARYREVPSNTKVSYFLAYGEAVEPFRNIAEAAENPNALTTLQSLSPDDTCSLHYAGEMLQMLSDGLLKNDRVASWKGTVNQAEWVDESSAWSLSVQDDNSNESQRITAPLVVYCTGSSPTLVPLPKPLSRTPTLLDLDTSLKPSLLSETLPRDREVSVGVIGASHSAVLVLMNLYALSQSSHPLLRVRWFSRATQLKYAEDKGDWILYDNTGLKGRAAQFARENLDGDKLSHSNVGKIISRIDCSGGPEKETQAMLQELPACGYIVQAVGFTRDVLPNMKLDIAFNHQTGGFTDQKTRQPIPGLYGAGIAFPEQVVDPAGNVEYAVGFIKFMRFLNRVVPNWVEASVK